MDTGIKTASIKFLLTELGHKLEDATTIARAAGACSEAGSPSKAVEIALDIEQLIYEAETFLNAASLLNRLVDT